MTTSSLTVWLAGRPVTQPSCRGRKGRDKTIEEGYGAIIMAGGMKIINGFISESAKLMFFMVLFTSLPQTSQQATGKTRCNEAITETLIDTLDILNECRCLG